LTSCPRVGQFGLVLESSLVWLFIYSIGLNQLIFPPK
jgi:hypothetical protein